MAASTINFGNLVAPDVAEQQLQIQRQQQLVDMLRQQSLTPTPTETAGGMAVRQSPFAGLAKMAAAYLSGSRQKDIDEKSLGLNKEMAARYAQILGGAPSDSPAPIQPNASAALGQGAAAGSVGPTVANAQRMDAMPPSDPAPQSPAGGNFNMANLLRGGVVTQLGGDAAGSAYWDQFKTPEGIKTSDTLGVSRAMMADALRREQAAKGQTMVREGSTIAQTNPDGSVTPKFTAPDLKQGANLTWNNGVPTASPIQNLSEINASMAGAQTRATEQGKAENDMVTVNTLQGPKMMTRAQAVQLAGGGAPAAGGAPIAPPAGTPRPANPMTPQPADADRSLIFNNEMKAAQARLAAAKTPEEQNRAQNDIAGLTREMKTAGIALQDEGSSAFEKTMGTQQADMLTASHKTAQSAADSLLGIAQSRAAIQGGAFQGSGAETKLAIAKFVNANIPGVNVDPAKIGNSDYLKSTLGQGLLSEAKTLGTNPSNADASRINDIVGSIGKDPQAMNKILDWREAMAKRAIQLHNDKVTASVKNGFRPQFDMSVKLPDTPPPTQSSTPNPVDYAARYGIKLK